MEAIEPKTPLRKPKRYSKDKKLADEQKMMEFLSYSSVNYFDQAEDEVDERILDLNCKSKESLKIERRIEEWLGKNGIHTSVACEKKALFFEKKRDRISSLSFFDFLVESDATDTSRNTPGQSSVSLELTPFNSKLYQKRSSFSSCANVEPGSASKIKAKNLVTFQRVHSERKESYNEIKEEDESPVLCGNRQPDTAH